MKYKIKIIESYVYDLDMEAKNKKEALKKAKEYYENTEDGYTGVCNANTLEDVKFKIVNKE